MKTVLALILSLLAMGAWALSSSAEPLPESLLKNDLEIYCQPLMQQEGLEQPGQAASNSAANLNTLEQLFQRTDQALNQKFQKQQSSLQEQVAWYEKADKIKELEKKLENYQTRPPREEQQKVEEYLQEKNKKDAEQQKTDAEINKQLQKIKLDENKKIGDQIKKEMALEKLNLVSGKIKIALRKAKSREGLEDLNTGKPMISPAAMNVSGRKVGEAPIGSRELGRTLFGGKVIVGTRAQFEANKLGKPATASEGTVALTPIVVASKSGLQKEKEDKLKANRQKFCDDQGYNEDQCKGYYKRAQETLGAGASAIVIGTSSSGEKISTQVLNKLENNYEKVLSLSDEELFQIGLQLANLKK